MGSLPILTVIEQSQISPPPATVDDNLLPLTFFDFMWLRQPPVHYLFFYELLSITETQFLDTIVPDLKHSLSTTLRYFYPFAGNLVVYSSPDKKPEIRYVEGDSVTFTFAKCHLDFDELTANHPRDCDKFYHLIPRLGDGAKTSDYIKIPVFSVQVTFFPNHGISIGMTNHHVLGDATTRFCFMNAWTSIARSAGTTDSFLSNGANLPFYDRSAVENPKLDESYLKFAKAETLKEDYQPQMLTGPSNKLRGTFVLTRNVLNELKKTVLNHLPTLAYVSSFTVACGYIWSCIAKTKNVDDELQIFGCVIDCRARLDPPIPATYFGNCLSGCMAMEKASLLTGKQGFITAAKLLGESLHTVLTNKDGVVLDIASYEDIFTNGMLTTMIGVAGTPKLKFYNMDFGWGNPKKVETISIDYNGSISMNACKDSDQDLEIGVCLSTSEMEVFVRTFDDGLQTYI